MECPAEWAAEWAEWAECTKNKIEIEIFCSLKKERVIVIHPLFLFIKKAVLFTVLY